MQVNYSSFNNAVNYKSINKKEPISESKNINKEALSFGSYVASSASNFIAYNPDLLKKRITSLKAKPSFGDNPNEIKTAQTLQLDNIEIEPGCAYNRETNSLDFGFMSHNAGRIELWIYKMPHGKTEDGYKEIAHIPLQRIQKDNKETAKWSISIDARELAEKGINVKQEPVYYGYRVWGKDDSNWKYDANWKPGSDAGFVCDVDNKGNRFNPNKLLSDPESTELSHDYITPGINENGTLYASGKGTYTIDTAPFAAKSVFVMPAPKELDERRPQKPTRALSSDSVAETHLKGLTAGHTKETLKSMYEQFKDLDEVQENPSILNQINRIQEKIEKEWKPEYAGTYKGASFMPLYFKLLGKTAVEFMPLQEIENSGNDRMHTNYWGYATTAYKAPDRQYAYDRNPGGPTKEIKEMINSFHEHGIKVFADVVYNHTEEGNVYSENEPEKANILNLRGADNSSYYITNKLDRKKYVNDNGCGADLNGANPLVQKLALDTLKYWKDEIGIDGFRFDLADVLAKDSSGKFTPYDEEHTLWGKFKKELQSRPKEGGEGTDIIAEPWSCMHYGVGQYPSWTAEWNDKFRNTLRKMFNKVGVAGQGVSPVDLIRGIAGSSELMGNGYPKTVNFIDCHDGFTLHDLFAYNEKQNHLFNHDGGQGEDQNLSWDQGGDVELRKQQMLNALTLLGVSAGTPMIQAGDERARTTLGDNNPYSIDHPMNWIDWGNQKTKNEVNNLKTQVNPTELSSKDKVDLTKFTSRLFNFRNDHPSLRPNGYFDGTDHNNVNGKDITWLNDKAKEADLSYLNNPNNTVIAFRTDATEFGETDTSSIYVANNKGIEDFNITLPEHKLAGKQWYLVADTSSKPHSLLSGENFKAKGHEAPIPEEGGKPIKVNLKQRSTMIFVEKKSSKIIPPEKAILT